jgi:hypothetical protein
VGSFYVYVGLLHAVADYVGYGERDGVESGEGQVVRVGVMVLWLLLVEACIEVLMAIRSIILIIIQELCKYNKSGYEQNMSYQTRCSFYSHLLL